jgi:hypothetical protein
MSTQFSPSCWPAKTRRMDQGTAPAVE